MKKYKIKINDINCEAKIEEVVIKKGEEEFIVMGEKKAIGFCFYYNTWDEAKKDLVEALQLRLDQAKGVLENIKCLSH